MMVLREACPQWGSRGFKGNDHIQTGTQNHRCQLCGRACVWMPDNAVIPEEQRILIERFWLESISLRGICRTVGVGLRWFLQFMTERFQKVPEHLYVGAPSGTPAVIRQRLATELDELWRFVGKTANRHWVWMAMDAETRQVLACHVGERSGQSARALWKKIPAVYQNHALFYTDHSAAYPKVIPSAQHRPLSELARKTNPVERFHCTLRQRVSRLVRATLSFSTKLSHPIGAIRYFICDYNLTKVQPSLDNTALLSVSLGSTPMACVTPKLMKLHSRYARKSAFHGGTGQLDGAVFTRGREPKRWRRRGWKLLNGTWHWLPPRVIETWRRGRRQPFFTCTRWRANLRLLSLRLDSFYTCWFGGFRM